MPVLKAPSAPASDSWAERDHRGDVGTSASITVNIKGGRGHRNRSYSLSGKGDKGMIYGRGSGGVSGKSDHNLLEDTAKTNAREDLELGYTRGASEDGRWESSHSIVPK